MKKILDWFFRGTVALPVVFIGSMVIAFLTVVTIEDLLGGHIGKNDIGAYIIGFTPIIVSLIYFIGLYIRASKVQNINIEPVSITPEISAESSIKSIVLEVLLGVAAFFIVNFFFYILGQLSGWNRGLHYETSLSSLLPGFLASIFFFRNALINYKKRQ